VEVWAQDEHRVGLKPILRRVWAPVGVRPVVRVRPRYEWVWVYGFVRPATGATEWLLLPRVNRELFELALAHFARAVGAGPGKRVLLVLDQAGWHTAQGLVVPEGLHPEFLPAYSPELQPAERLWPLCNEGVANKLCATIQELEELVGRRLVQLGEVVVRRLTGYHWWPQGT
jgi:transposase